MIFKLLVYYNLAIPADYNFLKNQCPKKINFIRNFAIFLHLLNISSSFFLFNKLLSFKINLTHFQDLRIIIYYKLNGQCLLTMLSNVSNSQSLKRKGSAIIFLKANDEKNVDRML